MLDICSTYEMIYIQVSDVWMNIKSETRHKLIQNKENSNETVRGYNSISTAVS